MKLTGWSFTLEDENEREIKIYGIPCDGSWNQWGATKEELWYTVSLCEQIVQQATADGLIEKEE